MTGPRALDTTDDPFAELDSILHEARPAFVVDRPFRPSPALQAFCRPSTTGPRPRPRARATRRCKKMMTGVSGFLATLTGKLVLGTAVAAASVGGMQAAELVDVPMLPDPSADDVTDESTDPAGTTGDLVDDEAVDEATDGAGDDAVDDGTGEDESTDDVTPDDGVEDDNPHNDFGQSVAADARDGGVDGQEISRRARERHGPDHPGAPDPEDTSTGDTPTDDTTADEPSTDGPPDDTSGGPEDEAPDGSGDDEPTGDESAPQPASPGRRHP